MSQLHATSPVAYENIESQDDSRTKSGIVEFDRVLGGGIVPGSLVLIGGSPGIGKSTIVIQMADKLGRNGAKVLYVSGEESVAFINPKSGTNRLPKCFLNEP